MNPFLLLAIGLISGLTSGLLGVGGGIVMVPAMTLLAKLPVQTAIGTSLAVIIPTAISGVIKHHQQGNVNWEVALYIGIAAILGAWVGAWLVSQIPPAALKRVFGAVLILVGIRMLAGR